MKSFFFAIAALGALMCLPPSASAATITNPLSTVPITTDGQFTGSIGGHIQPNGEWSNVTPLAFIATPNQAVPTALNDPAANSFLYAVIAPGTSAEGAELYLMYDFLGRTLPFTPGDIVADISFPITLSEVVTPITVQVTAVDFILPAALSAPAALNYLFTVKRDSDGSLIAGIGIDGGVGFGPSPESMNDHLLIELEVPLLIQQSFSTVLPPSKGVYSPAPASWTAAAADDAVDPPISSATFQINPSGSVTLASDVPEPSSFLLGGLGLAGIGLLRRKHS
jgi:hypothetical protein